MPARASTAPSSGFRPAPIATVALLPLFACALWLHAASARAQSFEGITVIELPDDKAAFAIAGREVGMQRFITVFVSPRGTYASVGPLAQADRLQRACVAWADGATGGSTIRFGLPPSEQSLKLTYPPSCQPFTLSFESADRVRVKARNKFSRSGALAPDAQALEHDAVYPVVLRVPLKQPDWAQPAFARYQVKDVSIGLLSSAKERLPADTKVQLGPLERFTAGTLKMVNITIRNPGDRDFPTTTVMGRVAAAEFLGVPADILYGAEFKRNLPQKSLTEAFEAAVIERYGQPSMKLPAVLETTWVMYWLFDLDGKQLVRKATTPKDCLDTSEFWRNEASLLQIQSDLGPWGCSLMLKLYYDGRRGTVTAYGIEAISGYILGLNHFTRRLEEVKAFREQIEKVQSSRPKL